MANATKKAEPEVPTGATGPNASADKPICGVVRPIANTPGYPDGHWLEIHQIIEEAAQKAGFDARLVSDDEAIGVIMGRIVSNLHDDPITVLDVSSLNPNVMFELGMRLAFDKPVVVIKDEATRYPFDASPIEYLPYPTDLRHAPLMSFQSKLVAAISNTVQATTKSGYRSFLKHFGSFELGELGSAQNMDTRLVLDEIRSLRSYVRRESRGSHSAPLPWMASSTFSTSGKTLTRTLSGSSSIEIAFSLDEKLIPEVGQQIQDLDDVISFDMTEVSRNRYQALVSLLRKRSTQETIDKIRDVISAAGGSLMQVMLL